MHIPIFCASRKPEYFAFKDVTEFLQPMLATLAELDAYANNAFPGVMVRLSNEFHTSSQIFRIGDMDNSRLKMLSLETLNACRRKRATASVVASAFTIASDAICYCILIYPQSPTVLGISLSTLGISQAEQPKYLAVAGFTDPLTNQALALVLAIRLGVLNPQQAIEECGLSGDNPYFRKLLNEIP
ncbi:MAG: hypothetical protein AAB515_01770 [Patescibacteria group bacterium]